MNVTPLRLVPCYQSYLWGGQRLKTEFGRADAPEVCAESWELSALTAGESLTEDGLSLNTLGRRAFWGSAAGEGDFPLLVKLIDAARPLSIQVHPSDDTAIAALGEHGKAEMWYIVDCAPQSFLYFGFSRRVGRDEFLARARDGTICDVLNRVRVKRDDVFFIPPGTVHAIGEGILIAEIQQSSNTTFRVFDYHRLGADGKPRALHLERAAETVDLKPIVPSESRSNGSLTLPGGRVTTLYRGRYFSVRRVDCAGVLPLATSERSFQHLLCLSGNAEIRFDGKAYPLTAGSSYFLPAALGAYALRGRCRALLSQI